MSRAHAALPPIERRTLDNGLRVNVQRDDSLPLAAINLWFGVGSRDDPPGRTGLAHLFEHMLFQGSEHVGTHEHFQRIQEVGGVANGSTWYDRTNYYETLPASHLDLGLWLESDRMGFWLPALDGEKLETQRQVVLNERRQRVENRPYGRAFERLHELLYPAGHPYHSPIIGYGEDIAALGEDDVRDFFLRHYVPGNAVLTLVGDVDPEAAGERVEAWFGEMAPGPAPAPPDGELPPLAQAVDETLEEEVELARVHLGFRAPGLGERGWYAADLLSMVLSGGKASPMWSDLVHDRQLAQDVGAWVLPTGGVATFAVVATARPGVEPPRLVTEIERHLDAAARRIDGADLERSRNRIQTAHFEDLQSFERRADQISFLTTHFDDPGRLATEIDRYLELDASDLRRVAAERLGRNRRVALTVVPRSAG